jgi:hypothetical protein
VTFGRSTAEVRVRTRRNIKISIGFKRSSKNIPIKEQREKAI